MTTTSGPPTFPGERSELEPLVEIAEEYRSILTQIEEAHALIDGDDPEMAELAEMELAELEPEVAPDGRPHQIHAATLQTPVIKGM